MGKEEVKMVMEVLPKEFGSMLYSFGILVEVEEESLALNLEVILEWLEASQLVEDAEVEVGVGKDWVEEQVD